MRPETHQKFSDMETNNAKVLRARLMDQPEDFRKLGINPAKVEKWEDGRRTKTEEVGSEIWYFKGCRSRNVAVQEKLPVVVVADIVDLDDRLGRCNEHMPG